MSLMWREREMQLDREFAERFKDWRNTNIRWHEENAQRTADPCRKDKIVQTVCALGIIAVCLALMFWEFRK